MKKLLYRTGLAVNLILLLSYPASAVTQEGVLTVVFGQLQWYIFIAFALVVCLAVYFMKFQDRRHAPINQVITGKGQVYSVGSETTITECVKLMTVKNIGALLVMDNGTLKGIFTERDALNKVLAFGQDANKTKVSEVMSKDPICMQPTSTVDEAMKIMTLQRFRHLPIVANGKVVAMISSGDLTAWLRRYKEEELQDLVDLNSKA